ncbi:MAG: LytTR family DNA-binding domain-containing protein [Bacteroidales bacterium]|nr:LytTR family DNA-binding domain-containing protein [Bacteroidales bacterium]
MFKIAVCDDTIADLSNIISFIDDYKSKQMDKNSILYTAFQNAADLIAAMESGQEYDLMLLDIMMPFITGMSAAKEIRQFDQDVKIIFMTSSPEFAVDSYSVGAFYYLLKPVRKEMLFLLLDKVISESEIKPGDSFLIKSKTGLTRIYLSRLEFAEVIGRTLIYHLNDGSVIEAVGSMNELEKELLSRPCFIKTHRSYIINMEQIDTICQREVRMQSRAVVPMSKANSNIVKSAYITFAFKE